MKALMLTIILMTLTTLTANAQSIDLKKSSFTWRGAKVVGSFHTGPIKMKKASVKNGKGEIVADMKSIGETTLKGKWKTKFLTHIKNADFFDVNKFPTAKLSIEKMDNGYLYGQLTIKGKTQDVTIPYKKTGKIYTGELGFDRTKFGIVYGSGNFFKDLGDKIIADTITLKFKVVTK